MKSRSLLLNFLIVVVAISPLIYMDLKWKSIPEIVPMHYDLHFTPDEMGKKNSLLIQTIVMSAVSIFVYFLLSNIRKFDPKQKDKTPSPVFKKLAVVIVVFISAFSFILLSSIVQHTQLSLRLILPLLGLLFSVIGNYMNNIRPNYFAGLRLPWTLSSDYNWRKTHHLAGKLWFWGGLLSAVTALFFSPQYSLVIFFSILAIMVVIPIIYSYKIYKQEISKI